MESTYNATYVQSRGKCRDAGSNSEHGELLVPSSICETMARGHGQSNHPGSL